MTASHSLFLSLSPSPYIPACIVCRTAHRYVVRAVSVRIVSAGIRMKSVSYRGLSRPTFDLEHNRSTSQRASHSLILNALGTLTRSLILLHTLAYPHTFPMSTHHSYIRTLLCRAPAVVRRLAGTVSLSVSVSLFYPIDYFIEVYNLTAQSHIHNHIEDVCICLCACEFVCFRICMFSSVLSRARVE